MPEMTTRVVAAYAAITEDPAAVRRIQAVLSPTWFGRFLLDGYTAYLCVLCDHDCQCMALSFDDWSRVVMPA